MGEPNKVKVKGHSSEPRSSQGNLLSEHTKGPWRYAESRSGKWRVYSGDCEVVRALSTHGTRKLPQGERAANARLIAAAPEMLSVLREVSIMSAHGVPGVISFHDHLGAMKKVEAILKSFDNARLCADKRSIRKRRPSLNKI